MLWRFQSSGWTHSRSLSWDWWDRRGCACCDIPMTWTSLFQVLPGRELSSGTWFRSSWFQQAGWNRKFRQVWVVDHTRFLFLDMLCRRFNGWGLGLILVPFLVGYRFVNNRLFCFLDLLRLMSPHHRIRLRHLIYKGIAWIWPLSHDHNDLLNWLCWTAHGQKRW